MSAQPYYSMVPKDIGANLKFRRELIRDGYNDSKAGHEFWIMCSRDMLFYINSFCWTYDPRKECAALPFVTYGFQDEALLALEAAIGHHDLLIEKSRDMGASWLCLMAFEWRWHFRDLQSFLMVSRKEDFVDKSDDPDSLFWKVDFVHKNQPKFLKVNTTRNKLMIHNHDNGSTIAGDSTTGDVARGGRRTAILLDEFAAVEEGHAVLSATADATTCRIFNSTPKGSGNAFYDVSNSGIRKLRLHWSVHPDKAKGLYQGADGKPRSPWYDAECSRRIHPMEISQELDIDYIGSDYQFFDGDMLLKVEREECRPPTRVGEIEYDLDSCEPSGFTEGTAGRWHLWTHVDAKGVPPRDRQYVIGVDVSAGTGASNSVIVVGDKKTGEKVAEFASTKIKPHELGKMAVSAAKWFCDEKGIGAYMVWEAPGPGREFGDAVISNGYRHVYFRTGEVSLSKKMSDVPGWWPTNDKKVALLGEYRRAMSSGEFKERSKQTTKEAKEYIFFQSGIVAHSRSMRTIDPSGARENHGDRVIATALCWKGIHEIKQKLPENIATRPEGSLAFRRYEREKSRSVKDFW